MLKPQPNLNPQIELLNIPPLVRQFLAARGVVSEKAIEDIFKSQISLLKNPLSMQDMKFAVTRLIQALHNSEIVCIYADFDLDGSSGLALLYEGMKSLGFQNLKYYQPKRLSEGYGFHAAAVQELQKQGVKLIVTVDVGITAHAACEAAKALGVDVIITDHHQPGATLPAAFAVVNPNQQGDTSGLGYLCGAGVAYYLLRALKRAMADEAYPQAQDLDLKSLLDFLTIATLTDMVPLVEDNRALVKVGLKQIENTTRPGLRTLLDELGLQGRALSAQEVAIRMAPKLNALSRMEVDILPVDLFLEKDLIKAQGLVQTMLSHNEDRVFLQQKGEKIAREILGENPQGGFVFVTSTEFHRGVVGLIATKLCQIYSVPAFVGSRNSEGLIVGSARVPSGSGQSVLLAMKSASAFLNRSGGHHQASGFELHAEQEENFRLALFQYFQNADPQKKISLEYDLEITNAQMTPELMTWLEALGPFGQSFPTPVFAFRSQIIKSTKILSGGHWKLSCFSYQDEAPVELEVLYFSPPPGIKPPASGELFDFLGEPQWNYFAGRKKLQILARDFVKHEKT